MTRNEKLVIKDMCLSASKTVGIATLSAGLVLGTGYTLKGIGFSAEQIVTLFAIGILSYTAISLLHTIYRSKVFELDWADREKEYKAQRELDKATVKDEWSERLKNI